MNRRALLLAAAALGAAAPSAAQAPADSATFIRWARSAAHPIASLDPAHDDWRDLEPLGRALAGARVVALSEAVHMGHEPLAFRNRLFRYLVEKQGFTAIAIESGVSESRIAHRYAAGAAVTRQAAVDSGFTWQFEHAPENGQLVDWIRQWNRVPGHHRVNFYGFDVPGSPGNMSAARRMQTGLDETLAYLATVDAEAAAALRGRLATFLDLDRHKVVDLYAALPDSTRDRITAAIADLGSLLERNGPVYASRSSDDDYRWGLRHAAGARQMDGWLRRIPVGFTPTPGQAPAWFWDATEVRDRAQAENVQWVLDQEGPGARILIYAAVFHISTRPVPGPGRASAGSLTAGVHLRKALGRSLVTIGNLLGSGSWGCDRFIFPITPRNEPSMDRWAGGIGVPNYWLDLRIAPPGLADWLARPQPFGGGRDIFELEPARAFDLIAYYERVGPVCPPPASPKP